MLLFAARAPLRGERAVWWLDAGAYELRVRAPGAWRVTLTPWRPDDSDRLLEGDFAGHGPTAIPVRVESDVPASVAVASSARSRFSLALLPFSPYSEEVRLADGRGPVDETFPVSLDPGDYLMQVDARGPWRLAIGG